jgi:DNA-binding CsgD family transcriptional regulator
VVPLTDREREIAVLAAAGQSSRAIAETLFLSVRTIDNHLGRIYDKLGVSNRADLASAHDHGPRTSTQPTASTRQGER